MQAVISAASKSMIGPSLSVVHTVPSRRRKLAPALSSPPKQYEPSKSPATNHLKPTGTSRSSRPSFLNDVVDHAAAHQGFSYGAFVAPFGTVREQVSYGHREVMVRVHQPRNGVTIPCRSESGSFANATWN